LLQSKSVITELPIGFAEEEAVQQAYESQNVKSVPLVVKNAEILPKFLPHCIKWGKMYAVRSVA